MSEDRQRSTDATNHAAATPRTQSGRKVSLFFRDPDLLECEVLHANPDADPEAMRFGTASDRFTDRSEIAREFVPIDER